MQKNFTDLFSTNLNKCIFKELTADTKISKPFKKISNNISCVVRTTFNLDLLVYMLFGQRINTKLGITGLFSFRILDSNSEKKSILVSTEENDLNDDGDFSPPDHEIVIKEIVTKQKLDNFDWIEDLSFEIDAVKLEVKNTIRMELMLEKNQFLISNNSENELDSDQIPAIVITNTEFRSEG